MNVIKDIIATDFLSTSESKPWTLWGKEGFYNIIINVVIIIIIIIIIVIIIIIIIIINILPFTDLSLLHVLLNHVS